jgi:tRNA A-37 threonylcarbamoyl transferase component Bud32
LSEKNLKGDVGDKVEKAFLELHRLGVLHGDVRAANIIVAVDGSICIIDYELARVVSNVSDSKMFDSEQQEVKQLLHQLRGAKQRFVHKASPSP